MITIEQKRKICDYLNSLVVLEKENDYVTVLCSDIHIYKLVQLGVNLDAISRCSELEELDITRLAFENDYADLYSNKGLIVFDEKIAIGEFLVGRVGSEVHLGKFNGDIYESETLDQEQRFNLTKILVMANYHA